MQEQAHYNIGNALFRRGEATLAAVQENMEPGADPAKALAPVIDDWENAIEHFDSSLELTPDNEDARFNKAVVEKRLEQLQQAIQQQQGQQQESEGEGGEGEGEQEGEQQEGGEGEDANQGAQPGDGQEGQGGGPGDEDGDGKPDNDFENPQKEGAGEGDEKSEEKLDGKLEAKENAGTPNDGGEGSQLSPSDREVNPDTGFSKHQARQLLRAYADEETQTRPPMRMRIETDYKNW